jgi:integrase
VCANRVSQLPPEDLIIYSVTDGVIAQATKTNHRKTFRRFLDHFRIDEKTLLTKASNNPKHVEMMIISYIKYLIDNRRLGRGSIHTYCFSIFHFFDMNDISLNRRKILRFLPPNEGTRPDEAYTHEQIHNMIQTCGGDVRLKVIILLMTSTGMRIGALQFIQLRDIKKIEEYGLYRLTVYASSPDHRYYTFCTPECAKAIDSYLEYRQGFGEELKPDAPLIREQFDVNDPGKIRRPKLLAEDSFLSLVKLILKRSRMRSKNVKQSHGFRKFAVTQMVKAKVDFDSAEYLVGHKTSRGIRVHYDRTTEEDRLAEFLKAVDLLTIDPANRLKKEIHKLMNEEKQVKDKQIEELRKADSQKEEQIQNMMHKQEQFEQLIQSLIDSGQLKPSTIR